MLCSPLTPHPQNLSVQISLDTRDHRHQTCSDYNTVWKTAERVLGKQWLSSRVTYAFYKHSAAPVTHDPWLDVAVLNAPWIARQQVLKSLKTPGHLAMYPSVFLNGVAGPQLAFAVSLVLSVASFQKCVIDVSDLSAHEDPGIQFVIWDVVHPLPKFWSTGLGGLSQAIMWALTYIDLAICIPCRKTRDSLNMPLKLTWR